MINEHRFVGKWVDNHCTVCGKTPIDENIWKDFGMTPPNCEYYMSFCPSCGAIMNNNAEKIDTKKRICEMAVLGCTRNPQAHTPDECMECDFKDGMCNSYKHSETLYNKGYCTTPSALNEMIEEIKMYHINKTTEENDYPDTNGGDGKRGRAGECPRCKGHSAITWYPTGDYNICGQCGWDSREVHPSYKQISFFDDDQPLGKDTNK